LHDTQAPWQATLQQTPSVQNPALHSVLLAHTAPCGLGPQLPRTHSTPGAQSLLAEQLPLQTLRVGSQP
jgi:hypothetical protein